MQLDATHEPGRVSWIDSAQAPDTDFPIQNLPHGVFRRAGAGEAWRGGIAIGDQVLDLSVAAAWGGWPDAVRPAMAAAAASSLNGLMAMGPAAWTALRRALSEALAAGSPAADALRHALVAQRAVEHALPARIGDYTDFFTSWPHMLNAGRVFRPDAPPLPQFKWLPIAYHGRASTVEVSGAPLWRPFGQVRPPGAAPDVPPRWEPTTQLDYEFEFGCWIGTGTDRGQAIDAAQAGDHMFGLTLLNDWSARDLQAWESLPLGPFLSKNFLTTVSPWVVTRDALLPFRCPLPRSADDPPALGPLQAGDGGPWGLDLQMEAWLQRRSEPPVRLSRSSFRHGHWSVLQMIAHHTGNGCRLRPGDLLGTGTQSGPGDGEQGCLLELTHGGRRPLRLADGSMLTWLEDGDAVTLRAWGEAPGMRRIGFGACTGRVEAGPGATQHG